MYLLPLYTRIYAKILRYESNVPAGHILVRLIILYSASVCVCVFPFPFPYYNKPNDIDMPSKQAGNTNHVGWVRRLPMAMRAPKPMSREKRTRRDGAPAGQTTAGCVPPPPNPQGSPGRSLFRLFCDALGYKARLIAQANKGGGRRCHNSSG